MSIREIVQGVGERIGGLKSASSTVSGSGARTGGQAHHARAISASRPVTAWAFAIVVALIAAVTVVFFPTTPTAQAAEPWTTDPDTSGSYSLNVSDENLASKIGQVWTDKSVSSNGDKATVTLSAISSASNLTTTTSQPLDIVLVLDTSGSMSGTKMNNLKSAATEFVNRTASANANLDQDNRTRLAIVTFASGANTRQNLNYVTSSNVQQYINTINGLRADGATYADSGLSQAQSVLNNSNRENAQKIVVFFTDGEPNHGNGFDNEVAADAVNTAHAMKQSGVTIYAIGVMNGADPSVTDDDGFNEYMNGVSSNYPNATAEGSNGFLWWSGYYNTDFGERADGNYYKAASDADAISSIFEEIYNEIASSTELAQPITSDLVFTDTLGDYVEVSGAPTITIDGTIYQGTAGQSGTYTFNVPVNYVAQQNSGNSGATVTVTVKVENDGTVTATIPAEALPLDVFNVSGGTTSQTYKANPIQINFSVKVSDDVLSENGVAVDLTKIDDEYAYINNDEGTVTFYTNSWSDGNNGETTATFTPAKENSYYGDSYQTSSTSKNSNTTDTANNVSFEKKDNRGVVTVELGNNGKIVKDTLKPATIGGKDDKQSLTVEKTVTGAAAAADFSFTAVFNANKSAAAATGDVAAGTSGGFSCEDSALKTSISDDFNADDTKTASFGQITFKKAGVYVFDVTEDNATGDVPSGWTYDKDTKTITITVTDNGKGQLVASVSDAAAFTNSYEAEDVTVGEGETSGALQITKKIEGTADATEDFEFKLTFDADASNGSADNIEGLENGSLYTRVTAEALNSAENKTASASFGDLTFTAEGTYVFTVVETNTSPAEGSGWTYDNDRAHTITITVTDNKSGNLEAKIDGNNPTFTNRYKASSVVVGGDGAEQSIDVVKTLSGRDWQDGDTFTFTLEAETGNAPMPEDDTVTITNETTDKTASFGAIEYIQEGAYTYTITETVPTGEDALGGVTYDSHTVTVTVDVTDTDHDGKLEASVSYDNSGATTDADKTNESAAAFTNTYEASGEVTPSTGEADVQLTKVLEGRDWTEDDEFEFVISADEWNTTLPEQTTVTVGKPDEGNSNTFNFGPFTFTQTGTYTYTITETNAGETLDGITYSSNQAKVTITVTDNLQGGYAAAVTITDGTFTNVYSSELDYAGETNGGLNIVKTVEGAKSMGEFTFNVNPADQASADKLGIDLAGETRTTTAAILENTAVVSVISPEQETKFTQADEGTTYTYTISEKNAGADGWTYDDTTYTVTITTEDDGKGGIEVTTTVTNNTTGESKEYVYDNKGTEHDTAVVPFTNTYNAEGTLGGDDAEGAAKIEATKTLVNGELEAGDFTFNVTDVKGAQVTSGTNDADGNITFAPVTYTSAKLVEDSENGVANYDLSTNTYSYTYTVAEDTSDLQAGVSANASSFQITVNVTDNGDGTLTISVDYPGSSDGSLAFTNIYATVEEGAATLTPTGAKALDYADGLTPDSIEGKFTFELEAVTDGAPMPDQTTVTNDAQGNVTFGEITYTIENVWGDSSDETDADEYGVDTLVAQRSKEFTYKVTETGGADGVTNDAETSKTFTVTVTDNGDGTVSISTDPETGALFTFTNTYSVKPEDSTPTPDPEEGEEGSEDKITVSKELTGRDMTEGEFSFALVGQAGTNSDGMELTASNAADGSVSFGSLTFSKPGAYTFDLYEVAGEAGGVSYDSTHHTVTATVTDNGDGTLSVVWSVDGSEDNSVTFANTYTAASTSVSLGATKALQDGELTEGQFSFQLVGGDENTPMPADADGTTFTATNAADGSISFGTIEYTKAGTYEYTISEVNDGQDLVTYDDTVYTVTVDVTDDGEGQLHAEVAIADGDETVEAMTFTNIQLKAAEAEPEGESIAKTGAAIAVPVAVMLLLIGAGVFVARKRRNV